MRKIKTKLITNNSKAYLEKDLNEFISGKDIVDIKFSVIPTSGMYEDFCWSALVMYAKGGAE